MAVTATFGWDIVKLLEVNGAATNNPDVTSLANGGFAAMGDHVGAHMDGTIFGSTGTAVGSLLSAAGIVGAIDQLSNGNIVLAGDVGETPFFTIYNGSGDIVVPSTGTGETFAQLLDVDVAGGLAGDRFVIASQAFFSGTNNDIRLNIVNNDGTPFTSLSIDETTANDQNPSVAALTDGGFAVAWHRNIGSTNELWYAVFNGDGTPRVGLTLLDSTGTVNRNASVVALPGGGFAVAYEDNGWDTNIDVTLAVFTPDGVGGYFVALDDIGQSSANQSNPHAALLANGLLAVTMTDNSFSDGDTFLKLVDPQTGATLTTRNITAGESVVDNVILSSVAGFGLGQAAVFHANASDNDVDGEALQGRRDSTGDGADDTILGDDFVDIMQGGGGNDILNGGANNDTVSYASAGGAVTVNLGIAGPQNTGAAGNDTITNVENASGSTFDDALTGNGLANRLSGRDGNDVLAGANGNDILLGDAGNDTLDGGVGNDTLTGGSGNDSHIGGVGIDTADFSATAGPINVDLKLTGAQNTGEGFDTFSGVENLIGSGFGDTLVGDALNNRIDGGGGNDTVKGNAAHDTLLGGTGNDLLYGEAGNDTLDAGAGIDRLYDGAGNDTVFGGADADQLFAGPAIDRLDGGAGNDRLYAHAASGDTFVFASAVGIDRVFNFLTGVHNLEIDASVYGGAAGNFIFRANSNPVAPSATRALLYDTDDGKLWFDADGNGAAVRVHVLTLFGAPTLAAGDIALV